MRAAVTRAAGVIQMEEVPDPVIKPNEVLVKIAYAGLCGTDPENLEQRFGLIPVEAYKKARILGHEASGTIAAIGKEVKSQLKVGQRVAMDFRSSCGACYYCQSGMEHFCRTGEGASGCFAEYATYPESAVYPLPGDISLELGALLEPVSVAVHAIDRAGITTGASVCVCGGGPIGLLCLQMAIKAGAARTLLSEPVAEKRALAKKLGADVVVDPYKEDIVSIGKKLTDGRSFNFIIDASGSPEAAKQCFKLPDNCGTILWVSVLGKDVEIPVSPFLMYAKELTLKTTFVSPYCFPRALAMLPKLEVKSLITDVLPLKDIAKAFELHKTGKPVKILIKP